MGKACECDILKRDMDLCRLVLLHVEEKPYDGWGRGKDDLPDAGVDTATLYYHVKLLNQAGLLEAHYIDRSDGDMWLPTSLTWQGHEFLDAARDNKNWERAKQAGSKIGGFSLDIIKSLLIGSLKEQARNAGIPIA